MAFAHTNKKGTEYFLHTSKVTLKGGHERDIFYFKKEVDPARAVEKLPEGYMVSENPTTGLPLLKKKA
jgi:hypothetical protein